MVPIHARIEPSGVVTRGEYGSQVEIKCDGVSAVIQLIDAAVYQTAHFWDIPAELAADLERMRALCKSGSAAHRMGPAVGYIDVPVKDRPTYKGSAVTDVVA